MAGKLENALRQKRKRKVRKQKRVKRKRRGFLKVIYVAISGNYLGGPTFVSKVCKDILSWIDGHSPEEKGG